MARYKHCGRTSEVNSKKHTIIVCEITKREEHKNPHNKETCTLEYEGYRIEIVRGHMWPSDKNLEIVWEGFATLPNLPHVLMEASEMVAKLSNRENDKKIAERTFNSFGFTEEENTKAL